MRRKDDRNEPTGDGIVQSCGARKLIDLYILHRGPAFDCWLVFFSDKTPRVCSVRNFRKWYRGNGDTNRDSPCPQSLSMKKIHSLSFSATRVIKIFFFLSPGVGQLMIQKGMLLLISWESRNCIDMSLAVHMCGAAGLGP